MKWNIFVGSLVLGLGLSTQSFGLDLLDRMLGMDYGGCSDKATCCETQCADPGPSCGCDGGCDQCCEPCKPKCRRTPLLDLLRGCGKKTSCCDSGCDHDPGCGCEPACGVDDGCDNGCNHGCDPVCGVDDGCATKCCKTKKCRRPLLDLLRRHSCKKSCCDSGCADPGCGLEPACGVDDGCDNGCDSCCTSKKRCRVSLLDRIFGRRCKKSCCDSGCDHDPTCGCDPGCGHEPSCGCGGVDVPAGEPKAAETSEDTAVGPAPVVDPSAFLPTKRRFIQTNLVR